MRYDVIQGAKVSAAEVAQLRKVVGWTPLNEQLDQALANSYTHFSVRVNNQLVGFVRVISDRAIHAYIADLIVHPDYQKKGIGKALIQEAVNFF